tara:strand:+ start:2253 stop:2882 length:630 start_codon:yes stop_codon:yes gene_type:complete
MARTSYIQTPSNSLIISVAEAKAHLRIPSATTQDDTYISTLISAAKDAIEKYCNIILFNTTVVQYGDTWEDTLQLYHSPVAGSGFTDITSIHYLPVGATGTSYVNWTQNGNWFFDKFSSPQRIMAEADIDYPDIEERIQAIKITYTVGYDEAEQIPAMLRQAAKIIVGQWYENRQEAIVGRSVSSIPMTATYILNEYKVRSFGLPTIML